jgi:hypothetical protein
MNKNKMKTRPAITLLLVFFDEISDNQAARTGRLPMQSSKLIRDFEAGGYLDLFLVTAVAAVLVIRLFLQITGFPQLGGDSLHVAHMLWGGLLMLVAIVILLSFVGRAGHKLAAVIGGAGFGAFIDEVGKFVTQDNDYFFQPALSIIYIVFILTYLGVRWLHYGGTRTKTEYLVNALQETQQVAVDDLDTCERDRALEYLEKCDTNDPLVARLENLLKNSGIVAPAKPDLLARFKSATLLLYKKIVAKPWFSWAVILFFVGQLTVQILHVVMLLAFKTTWLEVLMRRPIETFASESTRISYFEGSAILFAVLSAAFVTVGVWQIRRSRLRAYQMFQRSILVSILLTQPLMFYRDQWSALIGLTFDIVVFVALRFMIERERIAPRLTEK